MSLKIIAKPSPLPGSSSYIPVILRQPSLDQDQLLEYMAKDTALEKTDMGATLQRFQEALRFFLAKGFRLETCLGSYGLVARGGLESEDAPFRPRRPRQRSPPGDSVPPQPGAGQKPQQRGQH
jgi:hypothetical protein